MPLSPEKNRARWARIRREVMEHYSGGTPICACCGEKHYEFLALDHIHGGGRKEKQIFGRQNFFRSIQKRGYPPTYRVLCHNCNQAIGIYGVCPHQTQPKTAHDHLPQ